MNIEQTDIAIIGAGIVGLAIAERLSHRHEIVVVEKHESFGREASSRNSQVVHAGIYYPSGSLKSELCVKGSRMMYEFCGLHKLPIKRIGKIIPGIGSEEAESVHSLFERGKQNGAADLRILTSREREELRPKVICAEALFSPSTGILDVHAVMKQLESIASARGAVFAYASEANRIERSGGRWLITATDSDGREIGLRCETVINSAGLAADKIAATAGIDVDADDYRQLPCKGEFFRVSEAKNGQVPMLVYPVDSDHVRGGVADGVHLVQELDGSMRIGPNKLFDDVSISVNENHAGAFHEQMVRYLPWLEAHDLRVESSGVRAMRQGEDKGIRDYLIKEETDRSLPGLVNLIGMESPALTSSLAIAEYVEGLIG